MAAGRLIFPGLMPAVDTHGDRIPGAKAYFYANGTTTPANTFTDATLTVPNTNPCVADAVGVWPEMWADTATLFSVALTDSLAVPLPNAAWSGVSAAIDATLASVALALAAQSGAQAAAGNALAAQLLAQAAAAAISGAPFSATSASSLTIGSGSKSFVLDQHDKLFSLGQTVIVAETAAPGNQMTGIITAFDPVSGAMTVNCASSAGAGTFAGWTISLGAGSGVFSVAALNGIVTAVALKAALAIASTDITDFNPAVDNRAVAMAIALAS